MDNDLKRKDISSSLILIKLKEDITQTQERIKYLEGFTNTSIIRTLSHGKIEGLESIILFIRGLQFDLDQGYYKTKEGSNGNQT